MRRVQLFAIVAGLGAATAAQADGPIDYCATVDGLCASDHKAKFDDLLAAVTPAQRAQILDSQRFLDHAMLAWKAMVDPSISNAANSAGAVINGGLGAAQPGAPDKRVDPGMFGPRGAGATERLPGTGVVPGRNRVSGSAGTMSDALRSGSTGLPGKGGLTSQGGDLPGNNQQPNKDVSSPSGPGNPNSHGGFTRMTQESGYVKVVETRSGSNGGSAVIVTTVAPDGSADVDITQVGGVARPGHQRELVYHAHRDGPIGFFNYQMSTSRDSGATWTPITRGMDVVPIPTGILRNVDPDSLVGRSAYPPACAIANPDCARPLLLRYHRARPGTYSRPDETAGDGPVPRIRPNTYGNVVNPGIEPVAGGSLGSPGTPARSLDGGKLTNPADQRSGTGSGTGTGTGTGPKP